MIAQTSFNLSDITETYNEFLYELQYMIGSMFTPDGADWGEANLKEMQELIEEIK